MPFRIQPVALRVTACGRIERIPIPKARLPERTARNLIGRIPRAFVAHEFHAAAQCVISHAIANDRIEPVVVVRVFPWTIVMIQFAAVEQMAVAQSRRDPKYARTMAKAASFNLREVAWQNFEVCDIRG